MGASPLISGRQAPEPSNEKGQGVIVEEGSRYEVARTYDLLCGYCLGSHSGGEIGEEDRGYWSHAT